MEEKINEEMKKGSSFEELEERMKSGFRGEVLYNLRTGYYEVPTWRIDQAKEATDHKLFKFPKESVDVNTLLKTVYEIS